MNGKAQDLMMSAPAEVALKQLRELGILKEEFNIKLIFYFFIFCFYGSTNSKSFR